MIPQRLRSLRCITTFVVVLFIVGCIAAIANITKFVDIEGGLGIFEPYEKKEPNIERYGKGKFLKNDVMRTEKTLYIKHEIARELKVDNKVKIEKEKIIIKGPVVANQDIQPTKIQNQHAKEVIGVREDLHNLTDEKLALKQRLGNREKKKKPIRLSYLDDAVLKDPRGWSDIPPNYSLHAFYYPWYGNPEYDRTYVHWNHEYLPHWNKKFAKKWPTGVHEPPDDIGSNFYPQLGPYSSGDDATIAKHMQQMRFAGIGVLVLSWYPPGQADGQGKPTDKLVVKIMDIAHEHQMKVAFHSEPYDERTEIAFADDIRYILDTYGYHPAMYKYQGKGGKELPVFYLYDSYLINATHWAKIFRRGFPTSLRDTKYDGIFLGLLVENKHRSDILRAGFDGFYTYFASNGFTYGSSWNSWKSLHQFGNQNDLVFVPTVGPGYVDTRVRPWNGMNTKWRDNGGYYESSLRAAMLVHPPIISITSFNEWHEGTQIEPAVPYKYGNFTYQDYAPNQPDYYLRLTRQLAGDYKPAT